MIIKLGQTPFMEVAHSFCFEKVREVAFELVLQSETYPLEKEEDMWHFWAAVQALRGGYTGPALFRQLWQARRRGLATSFPLLGRFLPRGSPGVPTVPWLLPRVLLH